MPKIGMESLYQGYLQNLEAGKKKQTRLPAAAQHREKKPEERNDFDRFCAMVDVMRGALGPNAAFGSDNFTTGYYNLSKVRNHEIGEFEFESVFGELWDSLETELGKHRDVIDRLPDKDKAAVQTVLDMKAKEREEKDREPDEQRRQPQVDLNETVQYGDELDLDVMNETIVLTEEELEKLNEEQEKKQSGPETGLNETIVLTEEELEKISEEQEKKQSGPEAGLNETVVLTEEEIRKLNEELEKKNGTSEPPIDPQEPQRNGPKAGMESFYQGYLQNLEAVRSKQTRMPTAIQYRDKKPEERNPFDRFCQMIDVMRDALGPNAAFGNDNFTTGYYNLSKVRNYEIGESEFESVFGELWDNLETELEKHKDAVARLKPEGKSAVQAVLDIKAKEREERDRELDEQRQKLFDELTRDQQPPVTEKKPTDEELDQEIGRLFRELTGDQQPPVTEKKPTDEELDRERERLYRELTGDQPPEAGGKAASEPDTTRMDCITAALRQAGMTDKELETRDSSRLVKSRSPEFGRVVDALTSMAAAISRNGADEPGLRKMIDGTDGLTERCIDYLNKYPKVRSTQSGRDSYDLVLNTLAVFGDPNDKRIKACLDGVNKTRGISGRVSNRDYVDLKNYGADRLTGKAKLGSDVLKDIDKELVAQAKLAKKRDAAAREANARLKHLQLKKLYLKALVAPNGVVDPKSLDAQTAELGRNTALNNALAAAAKDPKMQDRIMAAEVNKLAGRRERNEFYEKAPEAPQRKNEDPQRGGPKLGG